jgi:hypothetical protein
VSELYEVKLARSILQIKKAVPTRHFPSTSRDSEFIQYADDYIEILAAVNTKALRITIYKPLTTGESNPIIMIDDEGTCYRSHGEVSSFKVYAEKLLGLPRRTFFSEWAKDQEKKILELIPEQKKLSTYAVAIYNAKTEQVKAHVVYGYTPAEAVQVSVSGNRKNLDPEATVEGCITYYWESQQLLFSEPIEIN